MTLSALKSSNFRTYVLGAIFSLLAIWMQRVTIGWVAWDMTGSSSFVGLVALVQFAPSIVLSPLFGVWVDRLDVKRAMFVVQLVNCLVMFAFYLVYIAGALNQNFMISLTAISGIALAANHPMRMSLTPRLVPHEMVASVVTITAINFNLARTLGPAIGGVLIGSIGVSYALLIQAILFLPFLFALSLLEVRPSRIAHSEPEPFFQSLRNGFVHAVHNNIICRAMVIGGTLAVVGRGTLEILPPLADGVFNWGPEGLGALMTAAGLGAVTSGFFKAVLPPQRRGHIPPFTIGAVVLGLALVTALGSAATRSHAITIVAVISFIMTLSGISMQTAIQMELEDDMRGRVMSLWAVVVAGGSAIGAWMLGMFADNLGYRESLHWAGIIAVTGLIIYLLVYRRQIRR